MKQITIFLEGESPTSFFDHYIEQDVFIHLEVASERPYISYISFTSVLNKLKCTCESVPFLLKLQ